MPLRIPSSQRGAFQTLIDLSPESLESLLQALKTASPAISARRLADQISERVNMSREVLRQVLAVAGSLYLTREQRSHVTEQGFEDAVVELAVKEGLIPPEDFDAKQKLRDRVSKLLRFDDSIGVSAKATDVLLKHKNPLVSSRILTDVRPIFVGVENPQPHAAVIVHTLQLVTRTDGRDVAHYIALDSADLKN